MRNFWKRTNRGLLLGGALLLGTSVYVGVDYYRFNHSKDDLEQLIQSYTANLAETAITPKDEAVYAYERTDAQNEARYSAYEQLIRTYWTDTYDYSDDYYYTKKSDMLLLMHDVFYEGYAKELSGYITDYSVNVSQLKFTKNGPNAALFSMTLDCLVDSYGYTVCPTATGILYIDSIGYEDDSETWDEDDDYALDGSDDDDLSGSDTDTNYDGALRTTISLSCTGELLYENGAWKISWLTGYNSSYNTEPVKGGT